MSSKLKIAIVGVLLAALALGGGAVAFAQGSNPPALATTAPGTHWGGGVITALGADNFTLHGRRGQDRVVSVNDQTRYFNRDAQPGSFSALQVGDRVMGAVSSDADKKLTALMVIDLGAKSETDRTNYKGVGVVNTVNAVEQSFTFTNRRGVDWEFYTDAATNITDRQGAALQFSDIQPGTRLFVKAEKRADGKWWALEIKIGRAKATAAPINPPTP